MAHTEHLSPEEAHKAATKRIWQVAGILSVITAIEFVLALIWPESMNNMRWILNMVFLTLTVLKAFYIIGEFMHLKHEAKLLIYSILIPCIFVVWFIVALIYEGDAIFGARF